MLRRVLLPLLLLAGCAAEAPDSDPLSDPASAPEKKDAPSSAGAPAPKGTTGSAPGPGALEAPPGPTGAAPAPALASGPLLLHYGFLQSAPISANTNGTARDPLRTAELLVPKAENVIVGSLPAGDPAYEPWRAGGGRVAFRQPMVDLVAALPDGDPIAARLAEGFDYVAIDELEPSKAADVRDGQPHAAAFAGLLAKHPGRVILYANSYNMAGSKTNLFMQWKTVLSATRDHGRALASQVYLATTEAFAAGAPTATTCASGTACYTVLSDAIDAAAPGLAKKTISVIDTRGTNLKASRADSYCGGQGALASQLALARKLGQPGVGTYALTYVANDVSGKAYASALASFTSCWTQRAALFAE